MTITEYLKGSFDFGFTEANIASVLTRRGIDMEADLATLTEKEIDLSMADLYIILANVVSGGGKRVQKGNRSVSERTYTFGVRDRRDFRDMATALYRKWGEDMEVESPVVFLGIYE